MKILVYGSDKFSDYQTFMRGVVVAIEEAAPSGGPIEVMSAGPYKINSFAAEFINRSEVFLRQKGFKPKYYKVPYFEVAKSFDKYQPDAVIYFGSKKETFNFLDPVITKAEEKDIPVSVYNT